MSVAALKQLSIQYLRGAVAPFSLRFEKGKKLTVVYGENAAGKSTICDALEFLGKQELNMPRAVRSRIDDLRKAMRPATPGALMDPADIRRRTEGVKQAVEEIQREIRDSIK